MHLGNRFRRYLRLSIKSEQTVNLLFDVGELRVTEAGKDFIRIMRQRGILDPIATFRVPAQFLRGRRRRRRRCRHRGQSASRLDTLWQPIA